LTGRPCSDIDAGVLSTKEGHMNTKPIALGRASEKTQDYSGNYYWDPPAYQFKMRPFFE
jgi:hypothetical protein